MKSWVEDKCTLDEIFNYNWNKLVHFTMSASCAELKQELKTQSFQIIEENIKKFKDEDVSVQASQTYS